MISGTASQATKITSQDMLIKELPANVFFTGELGFKWEDNVFVTQEGKELCLYRGWECCYILQGKSLLCYTGYESAASLHRGGMGVK